MMPWLNHFSLIAILLTPILGLLLLLFIPFEDLTLRKRVALVCVVTATVFHFFNCRLLLTNRLQRIDLSAIKPAFLKGELHLQLDFLSAMGLFYVLTVVLILLFCAFSRNGPSMPQTNEKSLIILALCVFGLLLDNFGALLFVQYAIVQALFFFNLKDGGLERSSTTFNAAVFFTAIDVLAFYVWSWPLPQLNFVLVLPWITRLLVPFFSPWARRFFGETTTEITLLYLAGPFLLSAVALARTPIENPFFAYIALVAAFFGGLLSLSDKKDASFFIRVVSVVGALFLAMLAERNDDSVSLKALQILGDVTVTTSLVLLLERSRARGLQALWYGALLMLFGLFIATHSLLWQLFGPISTAWLIVGLMLVLGLSIRLESPDETPSSKLTLLNAWFCFALLIASVVGLRLAFFPLVGAT